VKNRFFAYFESDFQKTTIDFNSVVSTYGQKRDSTVGIIQRITSFHLKVRGKEAFPSSLLPIINILIHFSRLERWHG